MTPTLGTRPASSVGLATNWRLSTIDNQTHPDWSFDRQRFLYGRLSICFSSCIFHSCIFHHCYLLLLLPLLHIPPVRSTPASSTPAFSTPAFSAPPLSQREFWLPFKQGAVTYIGSCSEHIRILRTIFIRHSHIFCSVSTLHEKENNIL